MHQFGYSIVRDNYSRLGFKQNLQTLPSGNLKEIIMKDCAQIIGTKRKNVKETIKCRQEGKCINVEDNLKCKICTEYRKLLKKFSYIDYDDQILLACKLLEDHKDILKKVHNKVEYLLVDEYQDINYAQWKLIKLLSEGKTENLFVVGDGDQSIYGFRGGNTKYIKNFKDDYAPNSEIKYLTTNYRCPLNIYKGSFYMVRKYNSGDIGLLDTFQFENDLPTKIKVYNFGHQNEEAYFIANRIYEIGTSYDILILIPGLLYAKPITYTLIKRHIDFCCDSDIKKTELFLLYMLLQWLKKPGDNFQFRMLIEEIINRRVSDITDKRENTKKQISNFWDEVEGRKTLYTRIKKLENNDLFCKLIDVLSKLKEAYKNKQDISNFISIAVNELKIWKDISSFENELNSFVNEIQDSENIPDKTNVRILTMNKAKGLEADYVFVVGLENGILPRKDESNIKEESRLLYVAMTRAKKELYLLHSDKRDRKITKWLPMERSEFIDAIPSRYIEEINKI
jgi:DNA helicase-2/ATP-dependent DNA helicase PcrA